MGRPFKNYLGFFRYALLTEGCDSLGGIQQLRGQNFAIFCPPPPPVWTKTDIFWTPPPIHCVHVGIECPLTIVSQRSRVVDKKPVVLTYVMVWFVTEEIQVSRRSPVKGVRPSPYGTGAGVIISPTPLWYDFVLRRNLPGIEPTTRRTVAL